MLAALACGLAAISGFAGVTAQAQPALRSQQVSVRPQAAAITFSLASPSPVSFTLSDPDAAPAAGASTLIWLVTGGATVSSWNVAVSVPTGTFSGCPEIPASAITAQCSSVTGQNTGGCNTGTFTLGTTPVQIASGTEAAGTGLYLLNLNLFITDAWKYKGHTSACTLNVTYSITAN